MIPNGPVPLPPDGVVDAGWMGPTCSAGSGALGVLGSCREDKGPGMAAERHC